MEENGTIADQLQRGGEDDRRSAMRINKFKVKPHQVHGLLDAWAVDAAYLKPKQGFDYAQLHRGVSGSRACLSTMQCGKL